MLLADGLTPCALPHLTAGKQQVPGVYLASSTALCEPGAEPLDAESYAAGLAVLAGSSSPRSKVGTSVSSGTGSPPPQHAPLMHAGRLIRLGGPVVPPQQQQQQGADAIAAVGGSQASTLGCASEQLNSRSSSSSSAGKGPVLDVYGQPRVVPPALSGTYSKARAAGSINAQYLSREGPTRRAVKTSSASLVRASGKDGELRRAQLGAHTNVVPCNCHPSQVEGRTPCCETNWCWGVPWQANMNPLCLCAICVCCQCRRANRAAARPPALRQHPGRLGGAPHGQTAQWLG